MMYCVLMKEIKNINHDYDCTLKKTFLSIFPAYLYEIYVDLCLCKRKYRKVKILCA